MQKSRIFLVLSLFAGLIVSGFQCSSTELTSARLYIQQKNYSKALEVLKKDIEKNPKSDEGWYLMGFTYAELGNIDSMMEAFNNSLAISNKFQTDITSRKLNEWSNTFNKGVSFYNRGNSTENNDSSKIFYDKSILAFKDAATIFPDSSDNYKNMAFVYMSAGRNEDAIMPLQKLVDLKQELAGYRYLGEIYYTKGSNKKSEFKNNGNVQDSIDADSYFSKAIKILEEGRKLYSDDDNLVRLLNASYIETGRVSEALESAKSLVDKEPENEVYRYNYGVLLLESKDYAGAEEQLKKALEIKGDYENAIYNLAVTYVRWGSEMSKQEEESENYTGEYKKKYESALPYLESVIKEDPENGAIWELMGKVYSVLGMQDKALDAFNKADQYK